MWNAINWEGDSSNQREGLRLGGTMVDEAVDEPTIVGYLAGKRLWGMR